jgi:fluoroquinolone transport system permease protein
MRALAIVRTLSLNDFRLVRRQSMLFFLILLPLLAGMLLRWGIPRLTDWLRPSLDLEPYYALILLFVCILNTPLYYGFVIGFLLLDERDDRTLTALRVTPLPMSGYLLYRVTGLMLLCAAMSFASAQLSGLAGTPGPVLASVVLLASTEAALMALFLANFAGNKVEGFALAKVAGFAAFAPLAYFLDSKWQLLVGAVLPTLWPARAYWRAAAGESGFALDLLIGWAVHLALLGYLLQRFRRIALS